jgi:hypothetical protein
MTASSGYSLFEDCPPWDWLVETTAPGVGLKIPERMLSTFLATMALMFRTSLCHQLLSLPAQTTTHAALLLPARQLP